MPMLLKLVTEIFVGETLARLSDRVISLLHKEGD